MEIKDFGDGVIEYNAAGRQTPGFVASTVAVTSVVVGSHHGHEHVQVFTRGASAGTLIVNPGDGRIIAERLLK